MQRALSSSIFDRCQLLVVFLFVFHSYLYFQQYTLLCAIHMPVAGGELHSVLFPFLRFIYHSQLGPAGLREIEFHKKKTTFIKHKHVLFETSIKICNINNSGNIFVVLGNSINKLYPYIFLYKCIAYQDTYICSYFNNVMYLKGFVIIRVQVQ